MAFRKKIKIVVIHLVRDTYSYIGLDNDMEIFRNTFEDTTEGITEFIGAIHGLGWIKKNNYYGDVLIKSTYIKDCIEKQQYKHSVRGQKANEFLRKCRFWMLEQKSGLNIELYTNEKQTAAVAK